MSEIKTGGSAFPRGELHDEYPRPGAVECRHLHAEEGMTLRDYFAIRAPEPSKDRIEMLMQFDRNRNPHNDSHKPRLRSEVEIRCDLAYEYADAMLRARGE
jgi:hypothetical protein